MKRTGIADRLKKGALLVLLLLGVAALMLSCSDGSDDSSSNTEDDGSSGSSANNSSSGSSDDEVLLYPINATVGTDFMYGFDASMVSQLEECGATFCETDGSETDVFKILANHGFNWARLRIWHTPEDDAQGDNDYDRTLAMAKRIKAAGLKFLLDFHYSDTWADPASQHRPAAWDDVTALGSASDTAASTSSLCGTVYAYTYDVLNKLNTAGCAPDMVQLGNEINPGMLTTTSTGGTASPSCGSSTSEYTNLVALLQAAAAAVDAVSEDIPKMIHLASSSGDNLQWWFNRMDGIDYDYIGLSYYPYYSHGTIANLRTYLAALKSTYDKDVLVVETSWGWSFDEWSDNTSNEFWYDDGVAAASNLVDSSNTLLQYLETQTYNGSKCISASCQNQVTIARAIVEAVAGAGGCGVFYWGGDWIPDGGNKIADNWENQTLFDFDGVALPSIDMFAEANYEGSSTGTDAEEEESDERDKTVDLSSLLYSSSPVELVSSSYLENATSVVITFTYSTSSSDWFTICSGTSGSSWNDQTEIGWQTVTGTYTLTIDSSGCTLTPPSSSGWSSWTVGTYTLSTYSSTGIFGGWGGATLGTAVVSY